MTQSDAPQLTRTWCEDALIPQFDGAGDRVGKRPRGTIMLSDEEEEEDTSAPPPGQAPGAAVQRL